jgi:glycosyltransferase involved in cell wall biosynthesis
VNEVEQVPTTGLRVAQLVETLDMGGAEHLAVQVANARAAAGDVSHLYVLTGRGPLSERIAPAVRVCYLGYWRASIGNPFRFLPSLVRGYRLLAGQCRADAVQVVQTHLPAANFWGLLLSLRRRCAVVGTVHNNAEFRYGDADDLLRSRLRRWAYRRLLQRAEAVVAVSGDVRRSLLEDLHLDASVAQRLVVVPNGVALPPLLPVEVRAEVRRRHGVPEQIPLILGAGRLTEQKNFAMLVEAAAVLQERQPDFCVLVAGEGELRGSLQARIDDLGLSGRMRLLGNVTDLGDLMQAADLFVLPSLWEGLPLVLLEALAAGLPVIATRIRGVAEVIQDGTQGRLVPAGDSKTLAAVLEELLVNPRLRADLSRAGRQLAKDAYSFDSLARRLGDIYRRAYSSFSQSAP